MREGWEMKKLGEVCENLDSKRIPITRDKRVVGEYPYYGASGIVDYVADYIFDEDLLCVSEDGANLLARTYPIAFPISGKTWVNNHAHVLRFKNSITQKYVELYLNSIKLNDYVSGMAQPKLNQAMLNSIPIPVPPLPEQQRIVAYIDQTFAKLNQAKANTQQNIKNAKELFETELRNVFENKGDGWEEKSLGELAEYDKTPNKRNDLLYIGLEDIESNTGKFIGTENQKSVKSTTFYFNENHILYGRLRPYLNKVLSPNFEGHCSTEIFPIKPKSNLVKREYLFWWLISNKTMNKINETWTGAVLPRANMNTVLNFKLLVPNLKTQQAIVAKLDNLKTQTQQLESVYQTKLNNIEELYSGILKRAFENKV